MIAGFRIDEYGNHSALSFDSIADLRWYLSGDAKGMIRRFTPAGNKLNSKFLAITDGKAKEKHLPINQMASRLSNMELNGKVYILRRSADGRNVYNLTDDDKRYLQSACEMEKKGIRREVYLENKPAKTKLAENVYRLRKQLNLTQMELARLIGHRTCRCIYLIESGGNTTPDNIRTLAKVFNISIEELVGEVYV